MTDEEYLVALSTYTAFGPMRIDLLTNYFKGAEKVWKADFNSLREIGLSEKILTDFISYRSKFSFKNFFDQLKLLKIDYITQEDKNYPENLRGIQDAPS